MDRGNMWREQAESGQAFGGAGAVAPHGIGRDERRMQVRAFSFWNSLLGARAIPLIADLDLAALPDFGPSSLLVSLSGAGPDIRFIGDKLRAEAGLFGDTVTLTQIPPRSLISRLTDRCTQVVSSQSALGFEAEFINHHGHETLYRGLLLPFSSDGAGVDYVFGVISWKEMVRSAQAAPSASAGRGAGHGLRPRPSWSAWRDGTASDWLNLGRRRT